MSQHVDNDLLADFHGGLLSDRDHALVEAHLVACDSCAAASDAFLDLRLMLRHAGSAPEPMPAALVDRFDAVLVAESRARTSPPDVVARRRGARQHRRRASRLPRVLLAAASVAVLGAVGVVAVKGLGQQQQSPSAAGPRATSSASAHAGKPGPHTYAFKSGGTTPTLTASGFAGQVGGLVEERAGTPSKSPDKPFGTEGNTGMAGPSNRCVDNLLSDEGLGKVLDSRPAQLDGAPVVLAIAGTKTPGAVRVVAVSGCPRESARIVTNVLVTVR